jgi:hypothetical protein
LAEAPNVQLANGLRKFYLVIWRTIAKGRFQASAWERLGLENFNKEEH